MALSTQPKHAFQPEEAAGSPAGLPCCFQKCFGEMSRLALVNTDRLEIRVVPAFKEFIFDLDKIHGPLLKFSNLCIALPKEHRTPKLL